MIILAELSFSLTEFTGETLGKIMLCQVFLIPNEVKSRCMWSKKQTGYIVD